MDNAPEILVLNFADSKIPVFKEAKNKDYVKYGDDNLYPDYLTYLFNKSAKHNAIITGKANYIFGGGFENGDFIVNRLNESLNDIAKKAILDIEIYGGFRLEVIWNRAGKIGDIYHVDYSTIRLAKEDGYYWKETWEPLNKDKEEFIPAFNPKEPVGNQLYAYNEYRPKTRFYPLPTYIGCNNFIETDIEISKYYLSAIRNGMAPSKMIQFFKGEPTEDKKREIERRFANKFTGAENAGRFILVFNDANSAQQVKIDDLSGSDLDKMFVELNKTVQQEIFSGHLVTSPMLFGIKTEGQLGGNTELQTSYTIFQNTYAKPKAETFEKEIEYLLGFSNYPGEYELQPTDPIGVQFDVKDVVNSLPKQFVFEKLGIPKELWNTPNIGADNKPTDTPINPAVAQPTTPEQMANDNIKNLTAKQHQQLMRIIRQYSKGQLTEPAARTLLKTGLGLNDDDINSLLGIDTTMQSQTEDDVIAMFDACGESKRDFEIVKSKKVSFDIDELEEDEKVFIQAFDYDVTTTENEIIQLIKNDKRITPKVIASVIGETEEFVRNKITALIKKGYIEEIITMDGDDAIIERIIPEKVTAPPKKPGQTNPAKISIKYSYEGPQDSRNRPFCAKMMKLNRLYSRAEIEQISARLGYSVFDRRGGFWRHKDGSITPYCRHHWKSNIVIKK